MWLVKSKVKKELYDLNTLYPSGDRERHNNVIVLMEGSTRGITKDLAYCTFTIIKQ
jgi:hypothetical protein